MPCICGTQATYGYKKDMKQISCKPCKKPGMVFLRYSCKHEECSENAKYGISNRDYCYQHRTSGMINWTIKRCEVDNCTTSAQYCEGGSKVKTLCRTHKTPSSVSGDTRICIADGCNTRASHKNAEGKAVHCSQHKLPEESRPSECKSPNCQRDRSFGVKGGVREYCADHKTSIMVNLAVKSCKFDSCATIPSFGFPNGKKEYCLEHKLDGMGGLSNAKCRDPDCNTSASYGLTKKEYCSEHRTAEMRDFGNKLCEFKTCKIRATWGLSGKEKCYSHKTSKMSYFGDNKICTISNCDVTASFGIDKVTHCKAHQLDGMKSLTYNMCTCGSIAYWGYKKAEACKQCKTDDMKAFHRNLCKFESCDTRSSYGYYYAVRSRCTTHAKDLMYDVKKPKCEMSSCDEYAFWSNVNERAKFCDLHKKDTHVDIIRKECKSCYEKFIVNEVYDIDIKTKLYCKDCNIRYKNYAHKEYFVKDMLEHNFAYIHNNSIKPGVCSSSATRPDFVVDVENDIFKVIIEVDENQHMGYRKSCETSVHKEIARIISIHENDLGGHPTIFIRFNPDDYKSPNVVPLVERIARLKKLLKELKNKVEAPSGITVYYLYYDGYDGVKASPLLYKIDNGIQVTHKHPKYSDVNYTI